MFNIGSGEIALIAVVALLILGPSRLPELARGIGKFMREFRRQTDEVRGVVEREFYKMDADLKLPDLEVRPANDGVPKNPYPTPSEAEALGGDGGGGESAMALPTDHVHSQLTAGAPESTPVEAPAPVIPSGVEGPGTPEPTPADVTPKS
jgi:sec-independent protein translocase protein TatB